MPLILGVANRVANQTGYVLGTGDEQRKQNMIKLAEINKKREQLKLSIERTGKLLNEVHETEKYMNGVIDSLRNEIENRR